MSDRRVLLVCGPAVGGMRRHLEALATGLPARGWTVTAAVPPSVSLAPAIPRLDLGLGDRPRPTSDLSSLHALRRLVRDWHPDVIHAHGVKAALLSLSAFRRGRPPTVVTFHNLWQGGPLTLPLRLVSLRAAAAIAVSEAVRSRLLEYAVRPRQFLVIRNGLDVSAFPRTPSRPEARPFTAAFVGRLTEEKGVPVLLHAFAKLPASSHARLLIAGDGPLRPVVESAIGGACRVTYLGHQAEVLPVYHQADLVVMPSLAEGHPLTALEAMACGLPVAASRVGGLPETVIDGETGVLLPPGDADALAGAIVRLEGDPELARRMGEAGRRRVEQEFSVERMLDQVAGVYGELLT